DELPMSSPFPWRRVTRIARWVVPLAIVAVAALYGAPVVTRALGEKHLPGLPAAAARPTALVQFDVTPRGTNLFLDGAPLASNPLLLGEGEVHTVTGVAEGYKIGAAKFLVDRAKTVKLKLERGRARPRG